MDQPAVDDKYQDNDLIKRFSSYAPRRKALQRSLPDVQEALGMGELFVCSPALNLPPYSVGAANKRYGFQVACYLGHLQGNCGGAQIGDVRPIPIQFAKGATVSSTDWYLRSVELGLYAVRHILGKNIVLCNFNNSQASYRAALVALGFHISNQTVVNSNSTHDIHIAYANLNDLNYKFIPQKYMQHSWAAFQY